MILLQHLTSLWLAGQPGVDEDLCSEDGANKVFRIIPEDLVGFSSVKYLQKVLKGIAT